MYIKNNVPYKYLLIPTIETPRNAELRVMNQGRKVCFVWDFCFVYPCKKISSYIIIADVLHKHSAKSHVNRSFYGMYIMRRLLCYIPSIFVCSYKIKKIKTCKTILYISSNAFRSFMRTFSLCKYKILVTKFLDNHERT